MMKALSVACIACFASTAVFASEFQGRQVANTVEFGQYQQGSVVVAQNRQDAQNLQSQMQLPVQASRRLVVVTGGTAMAVRQQMANSGLQIGQYGTPGSQYILTFADESADMFLVIMKKYYGAALPLQSAGIIIVKGGLTSLVGLTRSVLTGAVNLGINTARMAASFVYITGATAIRAGSALMNFGGNLVVKTTAGVFCLLRFTVGGIYGLSKAFVNGVFTVTKSVVTGTFRLVNGIFRRITVSFSSLFTQVSHNKYQLVLAQH
jgi:hypothetical protein